MFTLYNGRLKAFCCKIINIEQFLSEILQIDPAGATETFFQQELSEALQEAAEFTGDSGLASIANSLSSVTQQDISDLRATMQAAATVDQGDQSSVLR